MMTKGLANTDVKVRVLEMLKSVTSLSDGALYVSHGDIKEIFILVKFTRETLTSK